MSNVRYPVKQVYLTPIFNMEGRFHGYCVGGYGGMSGVIVQDFDTAKAMQLEQMFPSDVAIKSDAGEAE